MTVCLVERFDRIPYLVSLDLQRSLVDRRRRGEIGDTVLVLEHPPTVTLGRNATEDELLTTREGLERLGVAVVETDRGGRSTYHGPGQLVVYPVLDLRNFGQDIHRYLRDLEEGIIISLARIGVTGSRLPGLTGVWVGDRKIAAIGVKARQWVTSHGCSVNVDPDLSVMRRHIVPCGIADHGVTSIAEELPGGGITRSDYEPLLLDALSQVFRFNLEYKADVGIISA